MTENDHESSTENLFIVMSEEYNEEDQENKESKDEDEDDEDEEEYSSISSASFACEDCDYRWDVTFDRKELEEYPEENQVYCPMCGSVNALQI